ncbi:MAG: aminodeoxychorismate/anthranilate synthase component II [Calditrichaeota bacterium]|nr:MAG: aminodeoxychorismate/anthranilate synthase component II [Calditrichota bacterium]
MILVIDNYDSFTYNLVQYLGELGADVDVRRNDRVTLAEIRALRPRGVVISPGPGRPEHAGVSVALIREFAPEVPILGVCLGHQALAVAFGGRIVPAPVLMHGKTSRISHQQDLLFANLPNPFEATRYHSLVVAREGLPSSLLVTAESEDGVIMGLRHKQFPASGVQFHPESVLTVEGKRLLRNFLDSCGVKNGGKRP